MKKIILYFLFILPFLLASCDRAKARQEARIPSENIRFISVQNENGSIRVRSTTDTQTIQVNGSLLLDLPREKARSNRKIFDTERVADTLKIRTIETGKSFISKELEIKSPSKSGFIIRQNVGNITINGEFTGMIIEMNSGKILCDISTNHLDIDLISGSVEARIPFYNPEGLYLIRVGNGALSVFLPDNASDGDIRAWSDNGSIESDFGLSSKPSTAEFVIGNGPVSVKKIGAGN